MIWLALVLSAHDLQAIENAYTEAEFEQVTVLGTRLEARPITPPQKKRVYELCAFAEYFLGNEKQAAIYFQLMFKVDADASIDERRYPPKAVAFYKQQRERVPRPAHVVAPPAPPPRSTEARSESQSGSQAGFQPVALIPFGIGHFLLGDIPAGVAFFTVPAALIVTSIALYWVRQGERLPGDQYVSKSRADAMQTTQNVAAFAAIGVTVYGVIDAIVFAPDRVAARRQVTLLPVGPGLLLSLSY